MSFTTPAFIRKNTPELREKLEEMGLRLYRSNPNAKHLLVDSGDYMAVGIKRISTNIAIDCGTNADLFLAIAALRDDSDYMQWFIEDITKPYGAGGQICGLEPRRKIGEKWICQTERESDESMRISNSIKEDIENSYNGTSDYRKATVSEIITHFKNKEQ